MKKFITNKYVLTILGCFLFLGIWLLISAIVGDTTMEFPDPWSTIVKTGEILSHKYIYSCIGWTMLRMIIGFVIALISALIIGTLAGNFPVIRHILRPCIVALKSIPTAALVFLFLIISGARYAPIYIVILISFPILYDAIVAGISNVPKEIIDAMRIDSGNHLTNILRIKLPLSIPYLLVGIASSFALSFKIEIMAEIITGDTRNGLGSAILAVQKNDPSNMVPIFAYSLIAIVFILLISFFEDIIKKLVKID